MSTTDNPTTKPECPSNESRTGSYLDDLYNTFEDHAAGLKQKLTAAEAQMSSDASNPGYLAAYQARLQEYTLFRSAQSSSIKATKDIGASIIQNFR